MNRVVSGEIYTAVTAWTNLTSADNVDEVVLTDKVVEEDGGG